MTLLVPGLARGGMTRAYSIASALHVLRCEVQIVGALGVHDEVYPAPPANVTLTPVSERSFTHRLRETRRAATGDVLYAIKPRATSFGVALLCRRGRRVLLDVDDHEASFAQERTRAHGRSLARNALRTARRTLRRARNPDDVAYTRMMEHCTTRADAVTANTRWSCARYGATYLPSVKDTALFDPARHDADACRRTLGLGGVRVIMFPGTPRAHKGVEDVLEALEILKWSDARLVLVGGRETGDEFFRSLDARHAARIVRLPRFGAGEMPAVVAAAHVVVAPQRDTAAARAQFPMKLTDAMAMARPIVTTRVGDIPSVLDGAALLVSPSSPPEIARALESVFTDPAAAARLGLEARRRCEERFSATAAAAILRGLLDPRIEEST